MSLSVSAPEIWNLTVGHTRLSNLSIKKFVLDKSTIETYLSKQKNNEKPEFFKILTMKNLKFLEKSWFKNAIIGFTSYARNSQKKQYLIFEEMRNIFLFCLSISCLVTIWAKSNRNHCRQDFCTRFCQNCNQTADK